jgi:hypothetical protein
MTNSQAYLPPVLEQITDNTVTKTNDLLPWNLDLSEGNGSEQGGADTGRLRLRDI